MIEIEGLTKRFGDKTAVENLNLNIPAGRLFAFLGPNGAGKTTTIKLMVGLLRPNSGSVKICGMEVDKHPLKTRKLISYVPDQPFLYDKLTGREFLAFIREIYRMSPDHYEKKVSELSALFEIEDYMDELCEGYSHGMKQRVVLTGALLHEPKVIIVDEPMVGLDPRTIRLTKNIFRQHVEDGGALFMSTHTLSVAEELAEDIGIIHRGQLITRGSLDDLRERARSNGGLEEIFLQLTSEEIDV